MADYPVRTPARKLTPEERQELRDQAFDLERKIKVGVRQIHEDTWDLAKALYEFHELRGFGLLGYETLEGFLAQPELGISRAWFFRLVQAWYWLVVVREVAPARLFPLEVSKVHEVLPAIRRGEVKPAQALDDVQALGKRDLREKYRSRGGRDSLAAEEEPVRVRCPTCSQWTTEEVIDGTGRERR